MFAKYKDRNGLVTLSVSVEGAQVGNREILLHSKYDVIKEAKIFAENQIENFKENNILYGFGLGYHLKELSKLMDDNQYLYVFDVRKDIYEYAVKNVELKELFNKKNIKIFIEEDIGRLCGYLGELLNLGDVHFFTYMPSVQIIPKEKEEFKFILESKDIRNNIKEEALQQLNENYEHNKENHHENIAVFFNKYKNVPGVLVSAGPSLDYAIPYLKGLGNKAFVFSVGRALKSLYQNNILPDMFCIIDPQDITKEQIEGLEDLQIPFAYLDTANYKTVNNYNGPKFIAVNDIDHVGEENKKVLIDSGGSVSTAVLDMLIKFGCNPIIFVGQDLAFQGTKHHAEGSLYEKEEKEVKVLKNMRTTEGIKGETLYTTLGLLSFKKWMENKISDNPQIKFINASTGGAKIKGTEYMDFKEVMDKYIK